MRPGSEKLDRLPTRKVVELLARRELESVRAVQKAAPAIARVADLVASRERLVYVGAGTSGRLGALDAAECPPTFGVPAERVQAVLAGGDRAFRRAIEGAEDDAAEGARLMGQLARKDCVVVGIAASGTTPFVLGALAEARRRGAATALVTCAGKAARKAGVRVDVLVELHVGPEVVAGSTRLGAGTATKIALNAITTAAMVRLGKTVGPYMVGVQPTNDKLRARARRLVMTLGQLSAARAEALLVETDWDVKKALARG